METANVDSLFTVTGYGSLHLLSCIVRGSFSDDNWTRYLSMHIVEYHLEEFCCALFCLFCFASCICSILGVWTTQSSVSGHPGSVGHLLTLMQFHQILFGLYVCLIVLLALVTLSLLLIYCLMEACIFF